MFNFIKNIFKTGWQGFNRDGSLKIATIFILVLTLSLFSFLLFFRQINQYLISTFQEKVDLSVYFKEDTVVEKIFQVKEELEKREEIKYVEYISKEKALENFFQRHKGSPYYLESLEALGFNPFLASLNIKTKELAQYEILNKFLINSPFQDFIYRVDYFQRKPIIERLSSLNKNVNLTFFVFTFISVFLSILIVFNTIRLAILNSGEEISIMRLIGASNWFIRGSFLVQGAISGILAAFFTLLLLFLFLFFFNPKLESFFPGLNLLSYFLKNFWLFFSFLIFSGIFLATFSSALAIRKYLKI